MRRNRRESRRDRDSNLLIKEEEEKGRSEIIIWEKMGKTEVKRKMRKG